MNISIIESQLSNLRAILIIALIGFICFFSGLSSPFQGDDVDQIVDNVPVHSISHIQLFFKGSTFYDGGGLTPLTGNYYRPLQTTVYSALYTLFGQRSFYFHLFQLLVCIGSSIIFYLFLRYSFKPLLSLFLSLVFLVHPLDSQVVYAIPYLQDALYFFFGILGLYLLIRFRSIRSLFLVVLSLFLSLLSKETGFLFIVMAILYLFWWDRKRLFAFAGMIVMPLAAYIALRISAIGLLGNPKIAPIDNLSLSGRLLTAPSIMLFYFSKLIFPWKLADGYYWVDAKFSFTHVLLPFLIDMAIASVFIYFALKIKKKTSQAQFFTYIFFSIWALLGLFLILQIIPLDMTACEAWFYFAMAGILGMLGVILSTLSFRFRSDIILIIGISIICLLGLRSALRGLDWDNPLTLEFKDISASKEDYNAYDNIAATYMKQYKLNQAKPYVYRSIQIYPSYNNYFELGMISTLQGNYSQAIAAFNQSLKYGNFLAYNTYKDLSSLTMVSGSASTDKLIQTRALNKYPKDATLWTYYALYEDEHGNIIVAQTAIRNAVRNGLNPQSPLYLYIINNRPFNINLSSQGIAKTIYLN